MWLIVLATGHEHNKQLRFFKPKIKSGEMLQNNQLKIDLIDINKDYATPPAMLAAMETWNLQ